MAKTVKVGALIKEARTSADLTQEKLAAKIGGKITAADISKAERGETDLTNAQLKAIAKICGVTQSSLLNAPKNISDAKKTAEKKTAEKKTAEKKTAEKKTTEKNTAEKKTTAPKTTEKKTTAKKPAVPASANTSMKVTATEKKLVEAYRGADADLKKAAMKLLKGEYGDTVTSLLKGTSSSNGTNGLADVITDAIGSLFSGNK